MSDEAPMPLLGNMLLWRCNRLMTRRESVPTVCLIRAVIELRSDLMTNPGMNFE